jgi:hypothetical protein
MVLIDNVFSEGDDCKIFIKPSKWKGVKLKFREKERNEQADLLRKEATISVKRI